MKKLTLPVTIIVTALILGGSYYGVQVQKQNSIEKQQRIELEAKKEEQRRKELAEERRLEEERLEKENQERKLQNCLDGAFDVYDNAWDTKCDELGKLSKTCKDLKAMTAFEYAKERADVVTNKDLYWEKIGEYYDKKEKECNCKLFEYQYDIIEERFATAKDECYKKFK